ncbi:hypothetical protein N836_04505 [Leptolyngbya sp. Heron Island J]|uniref:DUF3598 family protein n=1 Tax=Leptolyngbya sp. Heron Island J TaxID=1385935 RepID=UPI0003B93B38|nr:DUF3598 family protein [Leptolyngbya sp. Heron Island J]ESA37075.1 hypothetical protein N836_04505 [Leptolyngbya sp. Heron Island J]
MTHFNDIAIEHLWDAEQWSYIRKNVGEWRGAFMQFSPMAHQVSETPSVLTLKEDRPNQHMTLVLKRTPPGKTTHTLERDLGYPGAIPYVCFFPTGAFSQGAMQRYPCSSFGAEFSLLSDHRRMRLVQLYKGSASGDHILDYVTLIPEYRFSDQGTPSETMPPVLTIDTLLGEWRGECLYLPATMETPQVSTSYWQAQGSKQELILSFTPDDNRPDQKTPKTVPQRFTPVDQQRWQAVEQSLQLWLLPGNVSCTVYPQLPKHYGAQIELCWYLSTHQRQRIVRDYDDTGNWLGTSLMLEARV